MKSKRFFICRDTLSTIAVQAPQEGWTSEWEVIMRDCARQIHWMFPETKGGLAKAKKVAKFFNELVQTLEEKVSSR